MKIKRGDIYYIELYLEPGKISDHNKRSNGTLSFTGVELMDARYIFEQGEQKKS